MRKKCVLQPYNFSTNAKTVEIEVDALFLIISLNSSFCHFAL